ncbi:hypothetical protein HGRIS_010788 [Hohenbuehelia grisea]|uniref:Uncharacterized protein n=1 Tax=Hohenbuehelia grisea TaxID=104357 RepID=A0ABR3IXV1_9AGAR
MPSQVCLLCSQMQLRQGDNRPHKFYCNPLNHIQFPKHFQTPGASQHVEQTMVTGLYLQAGSDVPQFVEVTITTCPGSTAAAKPFVEEFLGGLNVTVHVISTHGSRQLAHPLCVFYKRSRTQRRASGSVSRRNDGTVLPIRGDVLVLRCLNKRFEGYQDASSADLPVLSGLFSERR